MLSRMKMSPFYMILKVILIFIGIISLSSVTWGDEIGKGWRGEKVSIKGIQEALQEHTPELMSTPGVVGTGLSLCDDQPCIKVFVTERRPALERKIQYILKGYPFVIKESGPFRALPKKPE